MLRVIAFLLLSIAHIANATTLPTELSTFFGNKNGCFLLYDVAHQQLLTEHNPTACHQSLSPNSTFKIPLSLMAFDQKIIAPDTIFKWDHVNRELPQWNQDQTPQSWLKNSTIWVSWVLTPQLGVSKIQNYLHQFNYGNKDFTGHPGMHDGIMQAWLDSSLKISAYEQLAFLKKLEAGTLPISALAQTQTKQNLYLETTSSGWKLYGKTGSSKPSLYHQGWFVGFLTKDKQTYIFVTNFHNEEKNKEYGGPAARQLTQNILSSYHFS